jgi:hypothetical protein
MENDKTETVHTNQPGPGVLAVQLRWLAEPLFVALSERPDLLGRLFFQSKTRLHLVALATAQLEVPLTQELAERFLTSSPKLILTESIGDVPQGLRSALGKLEGYVILAKENYLRLIQLLRQPFAQYLIHQEEISDTLIEVLDGTPPPLWKFVGGSPMCVNFRNFSRSLDFLVDRGMASSKEELVAKFAKFNKISQIAEAVKRFTESLPMPSYFEPPRLVGKGKRLSNANEFRAIGRQWKNCLARYAHDHDNGIQAVYLWEDHNNLALISIRRYGRLGWFVSEMLGPSNSRLHIKIRKEIESAFDGIGIPCSSRIEVVSFFN